MNADRKLGRPLALSPAERASAVERLAQAEHPTRVVYELAQQYGVNERTIWRIYKAEGLKVPRGTVQAQSNTDKTPTQVTA